VWYKQTVTRSPRLSRQALVALLVLIALPASSGLAAPAARAQAPATETQAPSAEAQLPAAEIEAPATTFAIPTDDELAASAGLVVSDVPPSADELPTLSQIRDDTWAQMERLPEAEWSIPALAESLQYDPQAAFAFVRDSIAFDPYPGVLRGAAGTLAARAGNAYDRALLLGALLDAMLVPHRLAFADLPDEAAAAVLARAVQPPVAPLGAADISLTTTIDPTALEQRARRDYARLLSALDGALDGTPSTTPEEATDAVRHHAWVQALFGSEWQDLDPTFADATAGSPIVAATTTADAMPAEALQGVDIRLIAGTLIDGVLSDQVVLDRHFDAATAAASTIFLYFQPDASGLGGTITDVLSGDTSWVPVLLVDRDTEPGTAFHAGGRGSDVFGTATDVPELASLRLEVETHGPGVQPVTAARILLDRVPEELRGGDHIDAAQLRPLLEDDGGPFIMGQVHHLMVSTGGADRRDYALERSASADFIGQLAEREDLWDAYALPDLLWPAARADDALVVASEVTLVPALEADGAFRAFVARPRVTLTTFGRDPVKPDDMALATDLMIDSVALLPRRQAGPGEAARRHLWYGTLQTALETQFALKQAVLLDPADRVSVGASLASTGTLTLLGPGDTTTLPASTSPVLRHALAGGALIALSGDPAAAEAWWTIDPTSGETRSILDPGLGGVVPSGQPDRALRTFDSSYTNGAAARHAPRPPMQRPPGGYRSVTPKSTCFGGDSTGNAAINSCTSIPAGLAFFIVVWSVSVITFLAIKATG
jgi:hypothetical protein